MNKRKLWYILLVVVLTMTSVAAVACKPTEKKQVEIKEGPETGIYYCDGGGGRRKPYNPQQR